MSKYIIADIDKAVCKNGCVSFEAAMKKVREHIQKKIDPTFPAGEFKEWYDSDTTKPFHWNKNYYHWN